MNKDKPKVLIVSPEVVPFAKTGGLADVAGALSKVLSVKGRYEIKTILPKYKMVGLVNRVFADQDTMLREVMAIARQIASKAPLALYGC
ncbi:MAG: glycogen/starch synthase, partial [candidate division Zixibacteria bacterium]|nr:glycogen/starch synthase [candidate division Zixibacteria bacterium]